VSSTFLVQSNYYASQTQRTGAQDNARVATELIAQEIRSSMNDGFVVAGARTLTIRSPIVLGVLCNRTGNDYDVHTDGGRAAIGADEVAGIAVRNAAGAWLYRAASWSTIDGGSAASASACATQGADTIGGAGEFHRLLGLTALYSLAPNAGDVVMLFRQTTFEIKESVLDSTQLGLFRAAYGGSSVEFATGMDSSAQFQYRVLGGSTYADTISGSAVANIDAVRIVADTRKPAQTGGRDDLRFGWSVKIPVRNIR